MGRAVIEIEPSIAPDELAALIQSVGNDGLGARFVHVLHGPDVPENFNLLRMARTRPLARRCLVELTRRGYYAYLVKDGATRFVRSDRVGGVWAKITEDEYRINEEEVVFRVEPPLEEKPPKRLVVVFSAVHEFPNRASLQRYFSQDFPSIRKYLPHGTAVLRIADLGGVVGAFYLNTAHRPHNADAIRRLIESTRGELGIDHDRVVLFGVSKGGTGALYHGLTGGYRFASVDPILSDEHYETHYDDSHYTKGGIFTEPKEATFTRLLGTCAAADGKCALICSENSPQFETISRLLFPRFAGTMSIFNARDESITEHKEVGPRTINLSVMLLSMQLHGLAVPAGLHNVD